MSSSLPSAIPPVSARSGCDRAWRASRSGLSGWRLKCPVRKAWRRAFDEARARQRRRWRCGWQRSRERSAGSHWSGSWARRWRASRVRSPKKMGSGARSLALLCGKRRIEPCRGCVPRSRSSATLSGPSSYTGKLRLRRVFPEPSPQPAPWRHRLALLQHLRPASVLLSLLPQASKWRCHHPGQAGPGLLACPSGRQQILRSERRWVRGRANGLPPWEPLCSPRDGWDRTGLRRWHMSPGRIWTR
mmetsp:Transcript_114653/g.244597  ORF Transcript_114653/g.244597 Transcript_114653/m.244597 type:complete len:245 (+) Transcript_114653:425-1159(+)